MMFYRPENDEQQEINDAMESHLDALKFEHMVFRTSIVLYFTGLVLSILGTGIVEAVGLAVFMAGVLSFLLHFLFHLDTEKKRKKASALVQPFLKRQTLPLFRDLQEKFSDDPNIRFVHNDDGSVTVMRKKDDK